MSRSISTLGSGVALSVALIAASAGVAAAQSHGEWRGAWEAVPETGTSLADQFFHLEYTADARGAEQSEISGYVYNDYGVPATNVQLEITELDANGQPLGTEIRPVFGLVPAEGRAYFDVKVPRSASYKVAIRAFDFIEEGSSGAS